MVFVHLDDPEDTGHNEDDTEDEFEDGDYWIGLYVIELVGED
jgi:hypothetical protein